MMKTTLWLCCLGLLVGAAPSRAELTWEAREIFQKAGHEDKVVAAVFNFRNDGKSPVVIAGVKADCGCTTVALSKKDYAAGESGRIEALFTPGNRRGLQVKTIAVTIEGRDEPVVLTMKTLIPEVLAIKPRFVFWRQGGGASDLVVEAVAGVDEPVNIVGVTSSDPRMRARLEVVRPGKAYRIRISPLATDALFTAVITIRTDFPAKNPRSFAIEAHVK